MNDASDPAPPHSVSRFQSAGQKVPPFARYKGTSAWRKNLRRVREYAHFQAAIQKADQQAAATPATQSGPPIASS